MAPPRKSVVERLVKNSSVDGDCWVWTGATTRDGYGVMSVGRDNQKRVHRLSYEHFIGPIPKGLIICHKCDTPLCFNPRHLFAGTPKANTADMVAKGRASRVRDREHPNTKISHAERDVIRRRRQRGDKLTDIAADYSVSFQTISAICQRSRNYAAR